MDNQEGPADILSLTVEAAEAAAGMLPLDMVGAVADLVDPAAVAREMPWLAGELTKIALGRSDLSFDQRDQRFTDQAWRTIPYFRILGQSYRLFELLQYTPSTPRVRGIPLLMIPPQINRHYIMDLSPGRSLAEFAVSQGIQTFMIVWRNPNSLLGHGKWGLDDYLAATERASEVVKKIMRSEKVNFLGLCAGGITLAYVLAHLATIGDESPGSATFVVTMLTGDKPNVVGMLDTSQSRAILEQAAAAEQIVPGTALRSLFAMLRPNDLVYNYLVSGWLMGQSPAPFDVLAWNDDATRTTAKFALESTRLAMDGWDGNGPTVLDIKTDFGKVTCDSYHVGGYTDHITAWRACYDTAHLVGGSDKQMTLIRSGHIQSVVYPADSTRYDRWYAPPTPTDPDQWITTATLEHGSWWRPWTEWLTARSGTERQARTHLGNRQYPPLGPAPGTYVYQ